MSSAHNIYQSVSGWKTAQMEALVDNTKGKSSSSLPDTHLVGEEERSSGTEDVPISSHNHPVIVVAIYQKVVRFRNIVLF